MSDAEIPSGENEDRVEREFVLMPLFRQLRDRVTKRRDKINPITEPDQGQQLPPDTLILYPDRFGNYHPEFPVDAEAAALQNQEAALNAGIDASEAALVTSVAVEPEKAVPVDAEPVALQNHEIVPNTAMNASEDALVTSGTVEPEKAVPVDAEPVALQNHEIVPNTSMNASEDAPITVEMVEPARIISPENLAAANLQYFLQETLEKDALGTEPPAQPEQGAALQEQEQGIDRRRHEAEKPKHGRRQIVLTVPEVSWSALKPNWKLLRPALGYGAVGFIACLLMFGIPALRHGSSGTQPKQTPDRSADYTKPAEGYTLQAGIAGDRAGFGTRSTAGYTVNPGANAQRSSSQRTVRRTQPSDEQTVVVHHYGQRARVVRANSGVKKYSDLP